MSTAGYFGIGIANGKTEANLGTLWRSAASLGAAFTFQIGGRYQRQCSDTTKAWRLIPHYTYADVEQWRDAIPHDCVPVAVELAAGADPLGSYVHPSSAVYVLGAEDSGVPGEVLSICRDAVQLPGRWCLNVAVAGSIVMYDRINSAHRSGAVPASRPAAPSFPQDGE